MQMSIFVALALHTDIWRVYKTKKVGFEENECLIFIKLAVGLTFIAVSENA